MKTTKIISLFISFSLLVASCSSPSVEDKEGQLQEKKQQLSTLKTEIHALELEIRKLHPEKSEKGTVVNISTLNTESFTHSFEVNASLKAVQSAEVSPETSGQVNEIFVQEGESVQTGQLIAKLNTKVIESGISELKVALDLANQMYQRQEKLWKQEIGSEIEFITAKNAKESLEAKLNTLETQLSMASVKAPFSGIVDQLLVKEGELSIPGMPMIHLVNLDAFYLQRNLLQFASYKKKLAHNKFYGLNNNKHI